MQDRLALLGGTPVRTNPFPSWPPVTDSAVAAVTAAVTAGVWGEVGGPYKTRFEREFAAYHDATHGIAVCNGTVSLDIALRALGVGHGDEVIVPGYTFLATATAVLAVNALPVFADIEEGTGCIDPDAIEALISPRTKVIIPVHLAGHPADLDRICAIAEKHGLPVLEDAAHAHGAQWKGRGVGSFGAFGSWSFQASKNMTSGEGGILITNDDALADAAWSLHHCGRSRTGAWYEHSRYGGNFRLTEFQSALLLDQLGRLADDVARRERSAAMITEALTGIDGITALERDPRCTAHGYHLYQFRYQPEAFGGLPRERFVEALAAEGIPCSSGYGLPLDRQGVFADRAFDVAATGWSADNPRTRYGRTDLPVTERLCREGVWIPQTTLLGDEADIADVVEAIGKVARSVAGLGVPA
ncbi:DegT/DnrJ/EryC1/StrS family aminotransferase [Microlunatus speluncae]|uniref:DegT/DnrJ/EryC1/StrS family aminotransferase n=1 Tax=Microlunatus speluncae TaxID=2594267 RepID=UPI0012661647|nr:DegT/DnrJ/EryC1/StrS family aminotransferase [Microlunatus speluncae]